MDWFLYDKGPGQERVKKRRSADAHYWTATLSNWQKQPLEVLYRQICSSKFRNIHSKHLANLLGKVSNKDIFLWILRYFLEHLLSLLKALLGPKYSILPQQDLFRKNYKYKLRMPLGPFHCANWPIWVQNSPSIPTRYHFGKTVNLSFMCLLTLFIGKLKYDFHVPACPFQ